MGLFRKARIEGAELHDCLDYYRRACEITGFQTKEADLYNDTLRNDLKLLGGDAGAEARVQKAAKRLVEAANEAISRHESIGSVPAAASRAHQAWRMVLALNAVWASSVSAVVHAAANDMHHHQAKVAVALEAYQKAVEEAKKEDEEFLKQLRTTPDEIVKIVNRGSAIASVDTWEPKGPPH